jgi:hypothetical protein
MNVRLRVVTVMLSVCWTTFDLLTLAKARQHAHGEHVVMPP